MFNNSTVHALTDVEKGINDKDSFYDELYSNGIETCASYKTKLILDDLNT